MLDDATVLIPEIFASHAAYFPQQEAVVCGAMRRNWGDFNAGIERIACALERAGIGRGQQVAVLMGNAVEMLEAVFGVVRAGAAWCRCPACSPASSWPCCWTMPTR